MISEIVGDVLLFTVGIKHDRKLNLVCIHDVAHKHFMVLADSGLVEIQNST